MANYGEDFKDVYKPGRFKFKSRVSPQGPIREYMRGTPLKSVRTQYPAPVPEPISARRRLTEEYKDSKSFRQRHLARIERMLGIIISAEAFVLSLFLFSGNFTGMVISSLTRGDANIAGAVLFAIGVMGILLSLRSKNRGS